MYTDLQWMWCMMSDGNALSAYFVWKRHIEFHLVCIRSTWNPICIWFKLWFPVVILFSSSNRSFSSIHISLYIFRNDRCTRMNWVKWLCLFRLVFRKHLKWYLGVQQNCANFRPVTYILSFFSSLTWSLLIVLYYTNFYWICPSQIGLFGCFRSIPIPSKWLSIEHTCTFQPIDYGEFRPNMLGI